MQSFMLFRLQLTFFFCDIPVAFIVINGPGKFALVTFVDILSVL